MSVSTTTHLNFTGDARAALEFYHAVFGGDLALTTYGDVGMPADAPGAAQIVFGSVTSREGFRVMAYDIPGAAPRRREISTRRENGVTLTDQPFFLSLRGSSLTEVERHWLALSEGATVIEQLAASPWSPGFGMLVDRFGVTWVIDVATTPAG